MKSLHLATLTILGISALGTTSRAASDTWTGATDATWATSGNWLGGNVPGTGDTATFNAAGANTAIDLGGGVTLGALLFDTGSAAAYTIGTGGAGVQTLTLGSTLGNVITMNPTVAADELVNASLALSVSSTANNAATYYAVTNNSLTNSLTIAGGISASTTGVKTLNVTGSGNTAISGAITSGSGNVSIFKTGAGTLTLSGGGTFSGAGITDGANFTTSAVFREGTTILNGGTYGNSNGELVVGGVATQGGAGTDTTLQLNNGTTLNNISWLSIGRGNGNGTATSNLTLNGNATLSTTNLSAGFNAGNAGNKPKGSITLSNTSTLTVTSTATGATFIIGESAGSNFTMTVNDSAVVNRTGGTTALTAGNQQTQGALQIGRDGTGVVIMNGGTMNIASTDLGRGVNAASIQNGTLTIKTGATYNNEGDFRMAFAGSASGQATLNLQGGTLNIGTTTARTLAIGTFDGPSATVNIDSGNLNLNTNSSIRFNTSTNTGTKVINLNGGAITSYSDNATTANGSGVLDMMQVGAANSNNTFNLNGGTLTILQVVSTTNNGTRTFNFNGGTLKATGTTAAFFNLGTGNASANVRNGGAIIDTNGNDVTIAQALLHSNIGGDNAIDGGLTKKGTGVLTLSGANTYTGATTINNGTLTLASTGSLLFRITDASNTAILGTGIGTFDGAFKFDLTSVTASNTWTLVNMATLNASTSYGLTFSVMDNAGAITFTNNGGVWTGTGSAGTYTFTQSTGQLSFAAVPEPGVVALLVMGFGGVMIFIRRRKQLA
jgi:autotransporter-associated beta strand protein